MVNANTELVHVLYTVLFLGVLFLGGQAAQAFTFPSLARASRGAASRQLAEAPLLHRRRASLTRSPITAWRAGCGRHLWPPRPQLCARRRRTSAAWPAWCGDTFVCRGSLTFCPTKASTSSSSKLGRRLSWTRSARLACARSARASPVSHETKRSELGGHGRCSEARRRHGSGPERVPEGSISTVFSHFFFITAPFCSPSVCVPYTQACSWAQPLWRTASRARSDYRQRRASRPRHPSRRAPPAPRWRSFAARAR